jgi:hypothetical protein
MRNGQLAQKESSTSRLEGVEKQRIPNLLLYVTALFICPTDVCPSESVFLATYLTQT